MVQEYQEGDRVRVISGGKYIPVGTKGHVLSATENSVAVQAKAGESFVIEEFPIDQVEAVIPINASTGELERTRSLQGVDFVGTGTPEEYLAIFQQIRDLTDAGHTYLFMEKYLMSLGYSFNMIRKAFKQYAGIRAEDAVNFNYQYSPGTIPQFTLGWGAAKKGDGYIFVMPGVNWYSVFRQVDDMTRTEVCQCPTLEEAIENAKGLVKKLERWNPPVQEVMPKKHVPKMDVSQLSYQQPQLFMRASNLIGKLEGRPRYEQEALIHAAYLGGEIEEEVHQALLGVLGEAEEKMEEEAAAEKLNEIERDQMEKPVREEIGEKTPAQFFERKKMEHRYSVLPANVISSVYEYINNASAQLKDFSLSVTSHKYSTVQPAGTRNSTPGDEPDVMNAIASVSVLLEITDKKSSGQVGKKLGLMVFSVIRNNLFTTDTFKGEDDWLYALTDEGMNKYFQAERELGGKK